MKTVQDCSEWRAAIRVWVGEAGAGEPPPQLEGHLASCADCRCYAEELRAAAAGLRWLADRPVEPSPGFRARWTRAVEDAARPSPFGDAVGELAAWWHSWLRRNLRPALGVASLWALALVFRLSTPAVSATSSAAIAHSPVEIVRALGADRPVLAWQAWKRVLWSAPPQRSRSPQPRSEGLPSAPAAQSGPEPDALATVEVPSSNVVARADSPALLSV